MKKHFLFLLVFCLIPVFVFAHRFEAANYDGVTIYYNLTPAADAAVTYKGTYSNPNSYSGTVNIPSVVTYNDHVYRVSTIGNYAFAGCTGLTAVSIPSTVTEIGSYAFNGCGITSINIPNSVTAISSYTFIDCTTLKSVNVGNSVTSIGYKAFSGCTALESMTLGESVKFIEDYAFSGCTSLTSISIPATVTSVNGFVFLGCSNLAEVEIPNSVLYIRNFAFGNCTSLTSLTIPESVTQIGSAAFSACKGLNSMKVCNPNPEKISLGYGVFEGSPTSACTLYVPKGSKELYAAADQWNTFGEIREYDDQGADDNGDDDKEVFGDINGDGVLSIADVVVLVNLILTSE